MKGTILSRAPTWGTIGPFNFCSNAARAPDIPLSPKVWDHCISAQTLLGLQKSPLYFPLRPLRRCSDSWKALKVPTLVPLRPLRHRLGSWKAIKVPTFVPLRPLRCHSGSLKYHHKVLSLSYLVLFHATILGGLPNTSSLCSLLLPPWADRFDLSSELIVCSWLHKKWRLSLLCSGGQKSSGRKWPCGEWRFQSPPIHADWCLLAQTSMAFLGAGISNPNSEVQYHCLMQGEP